MTTLQQELPLPLVNLINNKNIDWNGDCEFDENGEVTGFKRDLPTNSYRLQPIPKSDKLLTDARNAERLLASVMQPATKNQIAIAIKKLSLHCGLQAKAAQEVQSMFTDYCHDLEKYPKLLIDKACTEYRTLPEGNNFMPSSGKLISLMSGQYNKLKFLQLRIDQILGKSEPKKERENKSISIMDALENIIK